MIDFELGAKKYFDVIIVKGFCTITIYKSCKTLTKKKTNYTESEKDYEEVIIDEIKRVANVITEEVV